VLCIPEKSKKLQPHSSYNFGMMDSETNYSADIYKTEFILCYRICNIILCILVV